MAEGMADSGGVDIKEPLPPGSESDISFSESEIDFVNYDGEHHLPLIMSLVDEELSEPYSIFTYRYFVYIWPNLSLLVMHKPYLFLYFTFISSFIEILYSGLFCNRCLLWLVLGVPQGEMRGNGGLQDG